MVLGLHLARSHLPDGFGLESAWILDSRSRERCKDAGSGTPKFRLASPAWRAGLSLCTCGGMDIRVGSDNEAVISFPDQEGMRILPVYCGTPLASGLYTLRVPRRSPRVLLQ